MMSQDEFMKYVHVHQRIRPDNMRAYIEILTVLVYELPDQWRYYEWIVRNPGKIYWYWDICEHEWYLRDCHLQTQFAASIAVTDRQIESLTCEQQSSLWAVKTEQTMHNLYDMYKQLCSGQGMSDRKLARYYTLRDIIKRHKPKKPPREYRDG